MRILVTGRNGQVARCLSEGLAGHQLVFAARPECDLTDFATIETVVAKVQPDAVISAAAYTAVDKAEDEPDTALRINAEAAGVLARAAARIDAPVIHLSTDYVFDGSADRPYREDDAIAPLGIYGKTKAAGEAAIRGEAPRHAILRTAWVYSPFGGNFVKTMLRLAGERDLVSVVADQIGCPTSADDIARGIGAVLSHWQGGADPGQYGTFHLAGRGETSWADFARAIFAASRQHGGPHAEVEAIASSAWPTRAPRPANSRLDCSRMERRFGFAACPWQEALIPVIRRLVAPA